VPELDKAVADIESASSDVGSRVAVVFATVLRRAGVPVPVSSVVEFSQALGAVGMGRRESVYWAGRATLLQRPEHKDAYDWAFGLFFDRRTDLPRLQAVVPVVVPTDFAEDSDEPEEADETAGDGDHDDTEDRQVVRYSAVELLRQRDFAAYSEADWVEARRLLAQLRPITSRRRSRRLAPTKRDAGEPDLGRTLRRALGAGGEPIDRAWRAPSLRPRRTVLLVDVSGSMEEYARGFLRFGHAAISARPRGLVEVFVLGTRLTRITRALSWRDPDVALAEAARSATDWFGGTRLGDGLKAFNDEWGVRGMARGAVVVVLSDGWDRGDPASLAAEMQRLRRVAHRIVWVNPLKASPGYAPVVRGMAAALPFLDAFVDGHSLGSLENLVDVISGESPARAARRAT
jgi:uncharacterized protein with von Willebrand factor type A (vWA) domain